MFFGVDPPMPYLNGSMLGWTVGWRKLVRPVVGAAGGGLDI